MPKPSQSELDDLLAKIEGLPGLTLEDFQSLHEQERKQACLAMDEMAKQFAREDAERKKLWGTKFPRVLGQKPPEKTKPINPVKSRKPKTNRTGLKGKK